MTISVAGEKLVLHPYKAVYWPAQRVLIVTDLHLGKITHFRKSGLFVPVDAAMDNYERLSTLVLDFKVHRLLFLGDLFHSTINDDWKHFSEFRSTFSNLQIDLVVGNHDILDPNLFRQHCIDLYDHLKVGPFSFSHYQTEDEAHYNLSGHVHPGVKLRSSPGHSLKLPCFYFGKTYGILPAFGTFTGLSVIRPQPDDQVIVVSDEELIAVTP